MKYLTPNNSTVLPPVDPQELREALDLILSVQAGQAPLYRDNPRAICAKEATLEDRRYCEGMVALRDRFREQGVLIVISIRFRAALIERLYAEAGPDTERWVSISKNGKYETHSAVFEAAALIPLDGQHDLSRQEFLQFIEQMYHCQLDPIRISYEDLLVSAICQITGNQERTVRKAIKLLKKENPSFWRSARKTLPLDTGMELLDCLNPDFGEDPIAFAFSLLKDAFGEQDLVKEERTRAKLN